MYQTARGFFLVTPETRRRLASAQHAQLAQRDRRSMLLSNDEALVMVHGDMQTERDGHRTHQCVQTNLADVICGGETGLGEGASSTSLGSHHSEMTLTPCRSRRQPRGQGAVRAHRRRRRRQ